jgi:hypothetical protein
VSERDRKIFHDWRAGLKSIPEIAAEHGITPRRVSRIADRMRGVEQFERLKPQ